MTHIERHKIFYIVSAIFVFFISMSLPHLMNSNFWAPDADRISMDGIFLLDFIKDLPGSALHPYEYTTLYYAKYPALSIGYRPPFFHLIGSLFYFLFGLSYISAKMAVLCFLLFGMVFWFKLVQETHDTITATISLLLWVTNPIVYKYSQYTMLEIPTLCMVIVCTYCLFRYVKRPSRGFAILLGILVGLTLWTNQKSGFILLVLLMFPIISGRSRLFLDKKLWLTIGIVLLFLIPLALITQWLGAQNIEQSIGNNWGVSRFSKYHHLTKNLSFLYHNHFSVPLLGLIVLGLIYGMIRKRPENIIYLVAIFSIYLFFSYIRHKIPRYSMYWIPYFCLFGALGLRWICDSFMKIIKNRNNYFLYLFCALPVLFQLSMLPNAFIAYASGYKEAAQYIIEKSKTPVVLFEGYANGQCIFFFRIHDNDREFVVLRGDKIISSSSINYKHKLKIHLNNKDEIVQAIHDMGVQFIVVESRNVSNLEIYDEFRGLLNDESRFRLHKSIEVESNIPMLKDQRLLIYECLGWKGSKDGTVLKLRLPVVGQTLEIEMDRLIKKSQ